MLVSQKIYLTLVTTRAGWLGAGTAADTVCINGEWGLKKSSSQQRFLVQHYVIPKQVNGSIFRAVLQEIYIVSQNYPFWPFNEHLKILLA